MRKLLLALALGALLVTVPRPATTAYVGSGSALPATCTVGDTFVLLPDFGVHVCRQTNIWSRSIQIHATPLVLPDNTLTSVWSVALPTSNTGCSVHMSFSYTATGSGNTVEHSGIVIVAFTNNAGTVSGNINDSGEVVNGTGCAAGCDSWAVSAVSTTATLNTTFNNTLSVNGGLTWRVLNNSCGLITEF